MKTKQLRNRIITYFVSIVVLLSILFSLITLLFSYIIEDSFFYQILEDERKQIALQIVNNETPKAHFDFVTFHPTTDTLPAVVRRLLAEEPNRKEFSAEAGKHYHIAFLNKDDRGQGILLAEVSEHLVVRELRGLMLGFSLTLLAIGLIIALLLALGTVKLAKKLLKPLDELMVIVEASPVENLPTNFASQFSQNEIGKFAQTLESALARIRAFVERERQFTRDISHELRTPVTISQGAVSLLKHTELNSKQQELVARIAESDQQMQLTLEALLALAREKADTPQQTNLQSVIEACIINNQALFEHKVLSIDIPGNVFVSMAAQELRLVVQNLLQNAVYHSQGEQIYLHYRDNTLTIADDGQGLPQTFTAHEQAFESGMRGPNSLGTGIGLSLVKRLCEKFSVEVMIESCKTGVSVHLKFA
ncbi:HAMP domain-containing sensor histidine kinase [Pseudoalteromonas piscicida]|uniref:sensor histidine kinase n=1 Tax=Pseudoalteromonas piscicida TaxID=43662 RepID=UPI0030C92245